MYSSDISKKKKKCYRRKCTFENRNFNTRSAKNLLDLERQVDFAPRAIFFSKKIIFLADCGDAYHRFCAASSRTIRETFARCRRLRWSLRGRCGRDYRDQCPYGLSVARSGKGEKEKTRTRPRKHPTSDRQAPMVSKHRASIRTGSYTGCLGNKSRDFPRIGDFLTNKGKI